MAEKVINLKKGLNIRMKGEADKSLMASTFLAEEYALKPTDFHGMLPKLLVQEGDRVKVGTPVFYDKSDERITIPSPVSGIITQIVRGEQRRILEIRIKADSEQQYLEFPVKDITHLQREDVIKTLLDSGVWAYIRQRPYDIVANPEQTPKMIVVSAFDTAPMAPDYDFIVHGLAKHFQAGLDVLNKLITEKVTLNIHTENSKSGVFLNSQNVEINHFNGIHPVGNVGVQVHHISPINKGEVIWYVNPQDVIIIGRLFTEGRYDATKIVAVAGSQLKITGYHKLIGGVSVKGFIQDNLQEEAAHPRVISGNVLTGTNIGMDGCLGFYDHLISVIPEGDYYEPFGWIMPGFNKFSFFRSFFSWLMPNKKYDLDTNYHGGERPFVVTGAFEKVFPMNIYPMQLLKACIIKDIEAMENLGIYEVAPEDFALCEFVDPSKTEIQAIISEGLDFVRKENM